MKVERFIIEFANYTKKALEHNELMNDGIKAELISRCDDAVKARQLGWITPNEAMRLICGDLDEDLSGFMT